MQTRKRKGGQIVHYSMDKPWHYRWKPLRSHNMDCGPNCFSLLKYAERHICEELARRTRGGIHSERILEMLDEAYGQGHVWKIISDNGYDETYIYDDDNELDYYDMGGFIENLLDNNEATIAYIKYDRFLHFFVVLKDSYGFHSIDAQTGRSMYLKGFMEQYTERFGYCTLSIMTSPLHHREPYKVSMNMVKKYFPTNKELDKQEKRELQAFKKSINLEEKQKISMKKDFDKVEKKRNKNLRPWKGSIKLVDKKHRKSERASMKMANIESRALTLKSSGHSPLSQIEETKSTTS